MYEVRATAQGTREADVILCAKGNEAETGKLLTDVMTPFALWPAHEARVPR